MAESAEAKPNVTLYWLDQSRSQRIVWLLEECKGMSYNIEIFKRQSNQMAPPELKKIHPLGKSPVVSIQSAQLPQPMVLAESGAIVEYLCDHFAPHLVPKRYQEGKEGQVGGETEQWIRYRYFMHYAEGSLMTLLLLGFVVGMIKTGPQPFFIKPITRMIVGKMDSMFFNDNYATHFQFLESQLASSPDGGPYLCGKELTAADILMSFPLIVGKPRIQEGNYPKLLAYIKMIEECDGYVGSTKKIEEVSGEPFKAML